VTGRYLAVDRRIVGAVVAWVEKTIRPAMPDAASALGMANVAATEPNPMNAGAVAAYFKTSRREKRPCRAHIFSSCMRDTVSPGAHQFLSGAP
jgi:hypothetical protein